MVHHHPARRRPPDGRRAWPGRVIAAAYAALGVEMVLQPDRFGRTPAYANLTGMFDTEIWGVLYLFVAGSLTAYLLVAPRRFAAVFVHTAATMLTLVWLAAFVIRRVTDPSTTIVTVVAWSVFLALLIRSATLIETSATMRAAGNPRSDPP